MATLTQITPIVNDGRLWSGSPVQFNDETYGEVSGGLLTIHRGQRTGADDDWAARLLAASSLTRRLRCSGRR